MESFRQREHRSFFLKVCACPNETNVPNQVEDFFSILKGSVEPFEKRAKSPALGVATPTVIVPYVGTAHGNFELLCCKILVGTEGAMVRKLRPTLTKSSLLIENFVEYDCELRLDEHLEGSLSQMPPKGNLLYRHLFNCRSMS